jgi:DNA-binding beta-propeller fold protein YncE
LLVVEQEISGSVLGRNLSSPHGVAIDRQDRAFLADTGNDRLIFFDSDLTPRRALGGHGTMPGLFDRPLFLTVDTDNRLWVSDHNNRRLCSYTERLEFYDCIDLVSDTAPLLIGHPTGVAVTPYGEAWIADIDNDRLALLDNLGQFDREIAGYGYPGGQLRDPSKITIGPGRTVVVCDAGNGRVAVYDEYGTFQSEYYSRELIEPRAVAFDADGGMWVLDGAADRAVLFGRDGAILAALGPTLAGTEHPLRNPGDFAFDADGRLFISDTGNNRLLVCRIVYDDSTTDR